MRRVLLIGQQPERMDVVELALDHLRARVECARTASEALSMNIKRYDIVVVAGQREEHDQVKKVCRDKSVAYVKDPNDESELLNTIEIALLTLPRDSRH